MEKFSRKIGNFLVFVLVCYFGFPSFLLNRTRRTPITTQNKSYWSHIIQVHLIDSFIFVGLTVPIWFEHTPVWLVSLYFFSLLSLVGLFGNSVVFSPGYYCSEAYHLKLCTFDEIKTGRILYTLYCTLYCTIHKQFQHMHTAHRRWFNSNVNDV